MSSTDSSKRLLKASATSNLQEDKAARKQPNVLYGMDPCKTKKIHHGAIWIA